jgi:flagellar biogenesis protein FliO
LNPETISGAASPIASCLAILALLAGLAFLARRLRGRVPGLAAGGKAPGKRPISILSARGLGGQQSLVIAEAGGQVFLLGVGRGGITLLSRLDAHD